MPADAPHTLPTEFEPALPQDERWPIRQRARGWRAELSLGLSGRTGGTRVIHSRHQGPLRIQRAFHPEGPDVAHVYLLHPPAGIVGGDDLRARYELEAGAHGLITSPGATRFYYAREAHAQAQHVASVGDGCSLEWLPQETLFLQGARARTFTRVDLCERARFFGWEISGVGRPSMGETFSEGDLDCRLEVYRDGKPLLLDRLRSASDPVPGLAGRSAWGTLIATSADDDALTRAREVLAGTDEVLGGATLLDDLLLVRGLAHRCEPLSRTFIELWKVLRPLVLGRRASVPRIWLT